MVGSVCLLLMECCVVASICTANSHLLSSFTQVIYCSTGTSTMPTSFIFHRSNNTFCLYITISCRRGAPRCRRTNLHDVSD